MSGKRNERDENESAMGRDPLADDDEVLSRTLFGGGADLVSDSNIAARPAAPPPVRRKASERRRRPKKKASHYKVISISLYNADIQRLDEMVEELKKMGHTKANRSGLIRFALDHVELEKMPRSY